MTKPEIERVQAYLRRLLRTERIRVVAPKRIGLSVEVAVEDEVIGTLHRDSEDGEVSYSVHLTILEEDLPSLPAAATRSPIAAPPPSTPERRRR